VLVVRWILLVDSDVILAVGLGCVGIEVTEATVRLVLNLLTQCLDPSEALLPAQVLDELNGVKFYLYLVFLIPFR
jgi:hypothetical protein